MVLAWKCTYVVQMDIAHCLSPGLGCIFSLEVPGLRLSREKQSAKRQRFPIATSVSSNFVSVEL
jgi:hypothetical protein